MARSLHIALLISLAALTARADSRKQSFDDFVTPLPVKPGETLVLGITGGWDRWDNPVRAIRRTAIAIKRKQLPGVWVETVENHSLDLGVRLVREANDFDRDGTLSPEEAGRARVVLFGQSLGGRAVLRLARMLETMGVPVQFALVVDGYGRDTYSVPANVRRAGNIYQRDHWFVKGARAIHAADTSRTELLINRRITYKGREKTIDANEHYWLKRFFMGAHVLLEYDKELWDDIERMITSAALAHD